MDRLTVGAGEARELTVLASSMSHSSYLKLRDALVRLGVPFVVEGGLVFTVWVQREAIDRLLPALEEDRTLIDVRWSRSPGSPDRLR
jgi:hypothetical protein